MCDGVSPCENEKVEGRSRYSSVSRQQKEIFIKQYQEGKTISEAAAIANLNINTAKTILYKYKRADEEIVMKQRGGNRKEKVTEEILSFLEDLAEHNPCITLKVMKDKLYESHQIKVSCQTVANSLKKLKITLRKEAIEFDRVNEPRTLDLRREYALNFLQNAPKNHEKIFFIDEIGFNLHLRRNRESTSQRTSTNVVRPTISGRNVTLIVAISIQGIKHQHILPNSNCSSAKFCSFIRELIEKNETQGMQDVWMVMDNTTIHKTREIRELVDSSSAQLVFFPSNSSLLNPIEQVFLKVKLAARRILSDNRADVDILKVINEGLQTVNQNDCNNYIRNMLLKLSQSVDKVEPLN